MYAKPSLPKVIAITCVALRAIAQSDAHAQADPFMADAKAAAQIRSIYFRRDLPGKDQETWAAGGVLWVHTGYWRDSIAFGGALHGALPLDAPRSRDGGGLLKP